MLLLMSTVHHRRSARTLHVVRVDDGRSISPRRAFMVDDRGDVVMAQLREGRHLARIGLSGDRLAAKPVQDDDDLCLRILRRYDRVGGERREGARNAGAARAMACRAVGGVELRSARSVVKAGGRAVSAVLGRRVWPIGAFAAATALPVFPVRTQQAAETPSGRTSPPTERRGPEH